MFLNCTLSTHLLAIKNALKQENLNPEIEEKLLQLQRYQERQMKHDGTELSPTQQSQQHQKAIQQIIQHQQQQQQLNQQTPVRPIQTTSITRKRPPSTSKSNDDEEWNDLPKPRRPPPQPKMIQHHETINKIKEDIVAPPK